MGKIGRNEQCLCGSGRKFKHCCLLKQQAGLVPRSPEQAFKVSLVHEIEQIQKAAFEGQQKIKELGVFILFSTVAGDAWLLEITDSDGVQLAKGGVALDVPVDQSPETIEINWSHVFAIHNREFEIKAYADRSVQMLTGYPTKEIHAAMKRIKKKFSAEQLGMVHLKQDKSNPVGPSV
ncbi:MAG: SEC-C domain-containing protein [Proteobacteria bacterium]|nr:SEC-C domain-containing protein [Pseudomonadota bacterium]MBU1649151.1 SEC-C domain-containing protein [Pseudomonadota bacterium]